MRRAIGIFLKGIIIGFVSIAIPGLSASTIAIVFGLYYLLIDSISSIFSNFKKSISFLFVIMLGYGVGSVLGATLVSKLYIQFPLPLILIILGFVIGSIPEMFTEIKATKASKKNYLITIIIAAGVILYSTLAFNGRAVDFDDMELYEYFVLAIVGLVTSTTLVIPGVDFAMILLSFGYYYAILGTIDNLVSLNDMVHNLTVLSIYLVSYGVGAFFVSNFIKKIIGNHEAQFKYANLGFIIAAPIVVIQKSIFKNPDFYYTQNQLIVGVALFIFGFLVMYEFNHFNSEYDLRFEVRKKRNQLRLYISILLHPILAIKILKKLKYYSANADKYTFEERFKVFAESIEKVNKVGKIHVQVYGKENLIDEACLFAANHQGKYDGVGITLALHDRPFSFLAEKEMLNQPFYKETPGLLGVITIDKDSYKSQYNAIIEMGEKLKNGTNFLAFPEGDFSDNHNELQEFHSGCLKSAYMAECPIIPICLYDSWKVYGKSSFRKIYPEVHFLKPIYYEEYKDLSRKELAELVKTRINEKLVEIKELKERGEQENEVLINQQEN